MKELSELAQMYVRGEKLSDTLSEIYECLNGRTQKFVDIDPTVNDDSIVEFREKISYLKDDGLIDDLCTIYEALNTYLIISHKYGEAAEWHLKDEFDQGLGQKILICCLILKDSNTRPI